MTRRERFFKQDDKLIYQKVTDPTPALNSIRTLRDAGAPALTSDTWHIGRIDAHILEKWVKEAGLKFSDREAVKDLIKRKLMDGDNAAWRVKEGRI